MSNNFINFGSWVNVYGFPLFWGSRQIFVMLFCFEEALFMCCKNFWNFPRRISFVNRSDILLVLKQSQCILMNPVIQDERGTSFKKLSYHYNALGVNGKRRHNENVKFFFTLLFSGKDISRKGKIFGKL